MISNISWNMGWVARRCDHAPSEVTLDWVPTWAVQFIVADFSQALQTQFKE